MPSLKNAKDKNKNKLDLRISIPKDKLWNSHLNIGYNNLMTNNTTHHPSFQTQNNTININNDNNSSNSNYRNNNRTNYRNDMSSYNSSNNSDDRDIDNEYKNHSHDLNTYDSLHLGPSSYDVSLNDVEARAVRGDQCESFDELDLISECSSPCSYMPGKFLQLCDIESIDSYDNNTVTLFPNSISNHPLDLDTDSGSSQSVEYPVPCSDSFNSVKENRETMGMSTTHTDSLLLTYNTRLLGRRSSNRPDFHQVGGTFIIQFA